MEQTAFIERLKAAIDGSDVTKSGKLHAEQFYDEFITLPLNPAKFRSLAFRGAPDCIPGFRPTVWKLLLGMLVASSLTSQATSPSGTTS
jgi:hypothetical protein